MGSRAPGARAGIKSHTDHQNSTINNKVNGSGDGELRGAVPPGARSAAHSGARSRARSPKRRWELRASQCGASILSDAVGSLRPGCGGEAEGDRNASPNNPPPPTLGTDLIPAVSPGPPPRLGDPTGQSKRAGGLSPPPPSPSPSAAGGSGQRCDPPLLNAI